MAAFFRRTIKPEETTAFDGGVKGVLGQITRAETTGDFSLFTNAVSELKELANGDAAANSFLLNVQQKYLSGVGGNFEAIGANITERQFRGINGLGAEAIQHTGSPSQQPAPKLKYTN